MIDVPWNLVPASLPESTDDARRKAETIPNELHRRTFLWTTAIVDEALKDARLTTAAARRFPDFSWISAGFIPVQTNEAAPYTTIEDGYVFGLCLLPSEPAASAATFGPLLVSGLPFSVIVKRSELERHQRATLTHPSGVNTGTAACWARPSSNVASPINLTGDGILTAAHVAVNYVAATPMNPPNVYGAIGFSIDAAVLAPDSVPSSASQLNIQSAIVVGTNVDIHLKSGLQSATILLTSQPSPYFGVLMPHRMAIDQNFSAGDSGALVTNSGGQDAAGIYIGAAHPTPPGTIRGACQIMEQVTRELAIDLYL
jgi:hypothetical protein